MKSTLTIGIPKEIMQNENRVSATPDTVKKMIEKDIKVMVESKAGVGSFFSDEDYKNAGAVIIQDVEELFKSSDIILKVKEPMFNSQKNIHEINMMKKGQILITFLHPANPLNHTMVQNLAKEGIISFSMDCIPRISRGQSMDALTSMSTIAGYKGLISASCRLSKIIPMTGTAVGMIQPALTLVIGTGVAGLQALATAKRLGSIIYAADIRPDAVEQAKSLGAKIIDAKVPSDLAIGQGGYAKHLPKEWLIKERDALRDIVSHSDIIVLSALVPKKTAPILIDEKMVQSMKPGSVIVDIAIDQGGNCELTESGNIVTKYNVTIDGTKNIPGSVPITASWMFAQNICNFVLNLIKDDKLVIDIKDEIIASSLITMDGKIVNPDIIEEIKSYRNN